MRRGWNDFVLGFDAQRQQRLLQPLGVERLDQRTLIVLFGIVAVLAIGWMLWLTTRADRERDRLLRAWHRLGACYARLRSEEHTSELQSLMRISYAVFCLKKKNNIIL